MFLVRFDMCLILQGDMILNVGQTEGKNITSTEMFKKVMSGQLLFAVSSDCWFFSRCVFIRCFCAFSCVFPCCDFGVLQITSH